MRMGINLSILLSSFIFLRVSSFRPLPSLDTCISTDRIRQQIRYIIHFVALLVNADRFILRFSAKTIDKCFFEVYNKNTPWGYIET